MTQPFTNDLFWDCECENAYIHSKNLRLKCPKCGAEESEQPDSHTSEVLNGNPLIFHTTRDYAHAIDLNAE